MGLPYATDIGVRKAIIQELQERGISNPPINYWKATRGYIINDLVIFEGELYKSLTNQNVGHNPSSDSTNWLRLQHVIEYKDTLPQASEKSVTFVEVNGQLYYKTNTSNSNGYEYKSIGGSNSFVVTQNIPTEIPSGMNVSVPDLTFQQCFDLISHYLNGERCLVACSSLGVMEVIYAKGTLTPASGLLTISLYQNNINYLVTYKGSNNNVTIEASDCPSKSYELRGLSGYFENESDVALLQTHNNIVIDWCNPESTPYYGPHHFLRKTNFIQNEERLIYENDEVQLLIVPDVKMWQIIRKGPFKHKLTIYKTDSPNSLGIHLEVIDALPGDITSLSRIPDCGVVPCKAKNVGTYTQHVSYYIQHSETFDTLYVKQPDETSFDMWDHLNLVYEDVVEKI